MAHSASSAKSNGTTSIKKFFGRLTSSETSSVVSSSILSTSEEIINQNLEDLTVLWLDANINSTEDCLDTQTRLRSSINYLKTFTVLDECTDNIRSVTKETIFLVVSGSFGETTTGQIHHLPQIAYIYVFCCYKAKHELWARSYTKIRGVYDNKTQFFSELTTDVKVYSQNLLSVSFLKMIREKNLFVLSLTKMQDLFGING
ncbi:hypothetical protein I4U23_021913 [Adineta vaga]|nr:hypothetical protein I4U23_021913 [Adineta vaga]